jgi:hypothetical protein
MWTTLPLKGYSSKRKSQHTHARTQLLHHAQSLASDSLADVGEAIVAIYATSHREAVTLREIRFEQG